VSEEGCYPAYVADRSPDVAVGAVVALAVADRLRRRHQTNWRVPVCNGEVILWGAAP